MKTSARLSLFVVALLFAAVEMRAQENSGVRPRVVAPGAPEQQTPPNPVLPHAKPGEVGRNFALPNFLDFAESWSIGGSASTSYGCVSRRAMC